MHKLYLFLSRDLRREAAHRKCHQNIMTPTCKTSGWIGNTVESKQRTFKQRPALLSFTIWLICTKWRWTIPSFCSNPGPADHAPGWVATGTQPTLHSTNKCSGSSNPASNKLRIHLPKNKHLSFFSLLFMHGDVTTSVGLADVCRAVYFIDNWAFISYAFSLSFSLYIAKPFSCTY